VPVERHLQQDKILGGRHADFMAVEKTPNSPFQD
jgi:hypothetical protein